MEVSIITMSVKEGSPKKVEIRMSNSPMFQLDVDTSMSNREIAEAAIKHYFDFLDNQ